MAVTVQLYDQLRNCIAYNAYLLCFADVFFCFCFYLISIHLQKTIFRSMNEWMKENDQNEFEVKCARACGFSFISVLHLQTNIKWYCIFILVWDGVTTSNEICCYRNHDWICTFVRARVCICIGIELLFLFCLKNSWNEGNYWMMWTSDLLIMIILIQFLISMIHHSFKH